MSTEDNVVKVKAEEVRVGDLIFFPNSRRAREVTSVTEHDGVVVLHAGDSLRWHLRFGHEVRKQDAS